MLRPNADPRVWNVVRWLYIGAGLLFLANISLGILNVFSGEVIGRGQVLAHLHAGTIGWITLSVIATALWVFASQGPASDQYVLWSKILTIIGLTSVAGYVSSFGYVFNANEAHWLLPLFGIPMWAVIVGGFLFTALTLKRQVTVTTVHLLLFGALLVAALAATMGVLWGLTLTGAIFPYPSGPDVEPVGAHAGPMDMYLALAFAAFVELFMRRDDHARWTQPGMWQMILGVLSAVVLLFGAYFGLLMIAPLALALFVASFLIYLIRIGWRTFTINPAQKGRKAALFFGGLFFPLYILLFVVFVPVYFIPGETPPDWLLAAFIHITYIGAATNLILAAQTEYGGHGKAYEGLEPWGYWILNLGLLAFILSMYQGGVRHGALLMAVGAVLALFVAWSRLGRSWEPPGDAGGPPPGIDPARPPATPPGPEAEPEAPEPGTP